MALVPATVEDSPAQLMRRATDVASVSREIVLKTAVNIQGRRYVKVEGWQAIAVAHGYVASSRDVERVETGFKAIGEVRRISDGLVLSTAEGFVGDDEKTWGNRDEFARRAMCQTRAISRACRSAFAHVVVMIDSGLSTTPAEEMTFQQPARVKDVTPKKQPELPKTKPTPEPKQATEVTKAWFLKMLQPVEPYALQHVIKEGWIMPNEDLADIPLDKVPTSQPAFQAIMNQIKELMDGDQIPDAEVEGSDLPPLTPRDDWWRKVIVPIPPKGVSRDDYLKDPRTIGDLEKNYLFGMWANWQPKSWTGKDGQERPPSDADIKFREALDAAGAHYAFKKKEQQ